MTIREILERTEHTCLNVDACWADVERTVNEAVNFGCYGVCVPPNCVERVKTALDNRARQGTTDETAAKVARASYPKIVTVIGFPNGYSHMEIKQAEARLAIKHGADELDIMLNVFDVKSGCYNTVFEELRNLVSSAGSHPVKVILETALLTDEEKIEVCKLLSRSSVKFAKTSTGFAKQGATPHDVKLLREHLPSTVEIKASGGIRTLEQAAALIEAGADRIGASKLIADAVGGEREAKAVQEFGFLGRKVAMLDAEVYPHWGHNPSCPDAAEGVPEIGGGWDQP